MKTGGGRRPLDAPKKSARSGPRKKAPGPKRAAATAAQGRTPRRARRAAGKTGTTQAARDAWFVGFTADYVAGVWMGYDDNSPLTGVTGGGLPAEIWRETMQRIHADRPPRPLPMARGRELAPAPGRSEIGADPAKPGFSSILRRLLGQGG